MSKLALIASGATVLAASTPVATYFTRQSLRGNRPLSSGTIGTLASLVTVVGYGLFASGLSKVPEHKEHVPDAEWKKRQSVLSALAPSFIVIGSGLLVTGHTGMHHRQMMSPRASLALFITGGVLSLVGWGVMAGALVHSDPEYETDMSEEKRSGRVVSSVTIVLLFIVARLMELYSSAERAKSGSHKITTVGIASMAVTSIAWFNAMSVAGLQ